MKNLKKPARLPRKAPSNQTGGTAWGKKLAAEFSRMVQSADMKKLILLNFPYIIAFYMVEKAAWLYRHCNGDSVVDRLMVLFMNFGLAYKSVLPSFHPFDLMVGLVGAAALKAVIYFKGKNAKKYRQGEEYGSARWGNQKDIEPFIDPVFENNVILTQTERLMMSGRPKHPKYARNKNVIVIGGSGSGKTRFYVKPNLMQMPEKVSYVLTDPKGTIIVECGKMLSDAGYKIKVLNTINFKKSMRYNPFHYIRGEKDILKLVNTIIANTKGDGEKSGEDFWVKAERLLYCALIGYIWYEAPEEEQNFSTLLEFINASEAREDDEEFKNPVDELFDELEQKKPSVSKSIAKVIGAYRQEDGYLEGGDCVVSWCLGHLAEYAAPEHYDERYENWRFEDLPILPDEWKLLVHSTKKPQFNVLRKLLRSKKFDYVVNACDAGREGEAIFRRVYALAGSKLPIKRLWISSMEDAAIQQGFENLKDGAAYDNLFAASECRAKADWLIGMNGTRAFTKKYGRKQIIGRVQTPTLAMLAERQAKIQNFVKEPYYKVELSGAGVVAVSEQMAQEQDADTVQAACDGQCAVVGSIERKRVEKKPPKLYDLTTLQREANRYYGLTASQTLQTLQELYEEKLVTYPRTDSQFVTEDMRRTVESLVLALDGQTVDISCIINNSKVTDHHAILPTMQGAKCNKEKMSEIKQKILSLVIWKLVQAVQLPFIYEDVLVTVCCQGRNFTAKYKDVLQPGYTAKPVPFVEPEKDKDVPLPKKLEQGTVLPVVRAEKKQGFTSPPKVYTEDTLLSAMETAGNKEFEKDTEKKGLGTPATRAAILEKLVSSGYVQRKGKQMIPTEDGVAAIHNIPDYLKSASMTAEWENDLLRMERGEIKPHDFMQGIHGLLDKMLADLRQIPTVAAAPYYNKVGVGNCPVCGNPVHESKLSFCCADRSCKFALWKESRYLSNMRKTLDKKMATDLLKKGRTHVKDFYSVKKDKMFAADLVMRVEDGRAQYSLEFPKTPMKKKP